ncbi:1-phosphatidylinositol-3-phosphate 5-kinase FAB1B [Abeliophyllum distichum]|uniref:1-phosphatidylinositol-3-phosphate 5-kinase n=1 Tax=Abeliophyllum distichum TaxID=126358 RepID=A0ABD1VC34_9LAMI
MGTPNKAVDTVKPWIPRRPESTKVPRYFWMTDQSCRVCYDCDSKFTIFNRRHHCRLCGRVFCAKCTEHSVPAPSDDPNSGWEDWGWIRVCNYCFKQWEQGSDKVDNMITAASLGISHSPSATSLVSTQSRCTCSSDSSTGSAGCSAQPHQYSAGLSPLQPAQVEDSSAVKQYHETSPGKSCGIDTRDRFTDQSGYCSRSDDQDDDYHVYRSHSEASHFCPTNISSGAVNCSEIDHVYEKHEEHCHEESTQQTCINSTRLPEIETQILEETAEHREEADKQNNVVDHGPHPLDSSNNKDGELVDYENNDLLWLPPEPEDEEEEREALLSDDDDSGGEGGTGEWGYLRLSSFGGEEYRTKNRSNNEHKNAMNKAVDEHFRALITQLLQLENLPLTKDSNEESWLNIITALSWEAATLLKPDMSVGGGMDPGGYVKVKCVASGCPSESMVAKGVVCKKNVANRRMTSNIDKPRLLLLGGALEYQRVANHLSSFHTLLQQEMDHLKMAVAKIDVHHPNVLLVEKSVSRYAQEYLLEKDISLVLNIKRPLLERIARCTGAKIVPSLDQLTTPKLGYCDSFHVEKFLEEHGSAGQSGKKLTKTLMFFEGCPKPLGCTILLKGASNDELKKVKHVVQYGVFAAYHLALETSFLADEGASLPELPLKSPIKVALPDKPSSIDRSISTIQNFTAPAAETPQVPQLHGSPCQCRSDLCLDITPSSKITPMSEPQSCLPQGFPCQIPSAKTYTNIMDTDFGTSFNPSSHDFAAPKHEELSCSHVSEENHQVDLNEYCAAETSVSPVFEAEGDDNKLSRSFGNLKDVGQHVSCSHADGTKLPSNSGTFDLSSSEKHDTNPHEKMESLKEDFFPSSPDHQSILVSLSTRCVWQGTVCERAHLFRIKYYGSFDKPLGRFLRDQLLDEGYQCRSCGMSSDAHVHCYTHRQGSLTISVKKLQEFLLPGEREGKIWMWHRCLRCPRTNGFPPATKRVVMSDAAWGLSFGKFLELSFSNHAAASRVASCGHSLHRDCLRFYGFGRMVSCFQYAPISVYSVYLPTPKIEFNYDKQEWIQKEANEVSSMVDLFFAEVLQVLHQISEKISTDFGVKSSVSCQQIAKLQVMLQKEKKDLEELLKQVLNGDAKVGRPAVDILEINRLRRQAVFHSYVWEQRLIHVTSSISQSSSSSISKPKEKPLNSREKPAEMNMVSRPSRGFSSFDSSLRNLKPDVAINQVGYDQSNSPAWFLEGLDVDQNLSNRKDAESCHSYSTNTSNQSDNLEARKVVRRVRSEEQFPAMENLSDKLDAGWTGGYQPTSIVPKENCFACPDAFPKGPSLSSTRSATADSGVGNCTNDPSLAEVPHPLCSKGPNNMDNYSSWVRIPFSTLYNSFNSDSSMDTLTLKKISEYNPVYVTSLRELVHQGGARLLLPMASSDIVVPVYDDEPTSIISYALISPDYLTLMLDEPEKQKGSLQSSSSLLTLDSTNLLSLHSFDDADSESLRSLGYTDESHLSSSGSWSLSGSDPLLYTNALHARVAFSDDSPPGNVKYTVTCYFAKQFEALRKTYCPSKLDFIRSLSRCKKWGAQGGKSNVFFAKTLDDRFIIKQVTKTELESFFKFAPIYFKYLSESINSGSPTCLAKVLGIYQVTSKHLKGGRESRMDVLVMENLLFKRNITRLYDLKGSSRSRYNPDSGGSNKVLLDQNLIEAMPTSPIFVGTKAKRLLERAVWNDTSFLASVDVMDYSLLVGVDEEKHELVLGIIDFMRQYTWDKHLETWVKASGILGRSNNAPPTVISPKQYKKRFRRAMSAYFLLVPDEWSSSITMPSGSQSDLCEEKSQDGASID